LVKVEALGSFLLFQLSLRQLDSHELQSVNMARVFIPTQMRSLTGGQQQVDLPGRSLREIVRGLEQQFPGIQSRLCDGDRIAPTLQVSIDGALTARGLLAPVGENSEVHFLPAIGGG
jgi:sulfur-carrier protein